MTDYSKSAGDGGDIVSSPCDECCERAVYTDSSSPPKCAWYPAGIPSSIHARQQECEHFVDTKSFESFLDDSNISYIIKPPD